MQYMVLEFGQYTTVPENTMLNTGMHEDDDYVITTGNTMLAVLGGQKHGAIPVRLVENGEVLPGILYFHQPVLSE